MIREVNKLGVKTLRLRSKWSEVAIYPSPRGEHVVIWRQGGRKLRKSFQNPDHARSHAEAVLAELDAGRDATTFEATRRDAERLRLIESLCGMRAEDLYKDWVRVSRDCPDAAKPEPETRHDLYGYVRSLGPVSPKHETAVWRRVEAYIKAGSPEPKLWLSKIGNPQTRNHTLTTLKAYHAWLVREGKAPRNPFDGVAKSPVPHSTPAILTPDQIRAVLGATPDALIPFVVLGVFCGIRAAEIQRMTWGDIDFAQKEARLSPAVTKTRIGRHVPIPENALAWLRPFAPLSSPDSPVCRYANPYEVLKPALSAKAGLEVPHNGFRHSACSYIMAQVRDPGVVADYLGNTPEVMRKHYLALVSAEDAKKVFDIYPEGTDTRET